MCKRKHVCDRMVIAKTQQKYMRGEEEMKDEHTLCEHIFQTVGFE